ncbi:MAG: hypothetical protein ACE5ES_04055 [Candidatus Nanoarchaeia archaeon]
MHLKRQKIPKSWPILRKGTTFIVRPNFNIKQGLPILVIIRDILKVAQNRKEVKKSIHLKHILLNNKPVINEKNSALLFDILTLVPSKKHYRIELTEKGKFILKEVTEKEINHKIAKITNKKILKNKKIQLNLNDGRNFLSAITCKVNDSVKINFKDKKVEKCLPLKEKEKVVVYAGKHRGEKGVINKINKEKKIAELSINKKSVNVLIKQLMVVE